MNNDHNKKISICAIQLNRLRMLFIIDASQNTHSTKTFLMTKNFLALNLIRKTHRSILQTGISYYYDPHC